MRTAVLESSMLVLIAIPDGSDLLLGVWLPEEDSVGGVTTTLIAGEDSS